MKKKLWIFIAVALMLAVSLSLLVACGGDGDDGNNGDNTDTHEANGVYESDAESHWLGCKACDEHRYGEGAHTYENNGKNKKCSVCGRTVEYTEEENALYWITGRDGTLAYSGIYTTLFTEEYDDGEGWQRNIRHESYDPAGRYFMISEEYTFEGGPVLSERTVLVLKPVSGASFPRAILYMMEPDDDGKTEESAYYVSPNYIKNNGMAHYTPAEMLDDCGIDDGDDLASLVAGIRAFFAENAGEPDSITFTRGEDGSVTLTVSAGLTGRDTDYETGEEYDFTTSTVISLTVLDGRLIKSVSDIKDSGSFEDPENNYDDHLVRTAEISYGFDTETFGGVDISGVQPTDAYYADFIIHIEGCDTVIIFDDALMGETVTAEMLRAALASRIGTFVGDYDEISAFEFYTDKERTHAFESVEVTEEENDIYLRFAPPEDMSVVLTLFSRTNDDGEEITVLQIAYLWQAGERFYPRFGSFLHYELLKVNGETVTGYSSFLCEGGHVYTVLYDGEYRDEEIEFEHIPLEEWAYNEYSHWHKCGECSDETFDFGMHNYSFSGGNKVCIDCGYTIEYTDAENFAYWAEGRNKSKNTEYSYKYSITEEYHDLINDIIMGRREFTESATDFEYYSKAVLYGLDRTGELELIINELVALKYIKSTGRWKLYTERTLPDGSIQKDGVYKAPSFSVDSLCRYSPAVFVTEMCIGDGATFEEFCTVFRQKYEEMYSDVGCVVSNMAIRRNDDGTVSFLFTATGEYTDSMVSDSDYIKNTYVCNYEIVVGDSGIEKCIEVSVYNSYYGDETKNTSEKDTITTCFENRFDRDTYDSISVETDTTRDEYVGSISFIINGYHYNYSDGGKTIGSTYTLREAQEHLAYVGENASQPLFVTDVDPDMFVIYTDEAKTKRFTSTTVDSESVTLYVDMVIPEGKAIVIIVNEFGTSRAIDLCYFRDVGGTFDTSKLYSIYPMIELDGEEVTDGSATAVITCSESRIYTVVYKAR